MADYSDEASLRRVAMLTPEQQANEGNPDEDRRSLLSELGRASDPRIKAVLQREYNRRFNGIITPPAVATSMRDGFPELRGDSGPAVTGTAPAARSGLAAFLSDGNAPAAPRAGLADFLASMPDAPATPQQSGTMRRLADYGLSAVQGAIQVPQAAVGLADLVTGGKVGKTLENAGGAVGFRPDEASAYLESLKTPEQQAANKAVADASQGAPGDDQGLLSRVGRVGMAAVQNPSVIAHSIVQSLPSMGAGGVVGRGALALAPRLGALATGIGEGVTTMGQQAEQIRTDPSNTSRELTGRQSALAAGSGALTGLIGGFSNKLAKSMGFETAENLLTGIHANPAAQMGVVRRVLGGAVTEGFLEELPQSVQEQVAQNMALGKPLDDGVDQQAVLGALSGAAMGAGAQAFHGHPAPKSAGDVIREDLQPGTGPATNALNSGIEDAAKKADAAQSAAPDANVPHPPRPATAAQIAAIRALPPEQQEDAMKLVETGNRADVVPGVRRYAQKKLDALLGDLQPVNPTDGAPVATKEAAPGNPVDQQLALQEADLRAAETARQPAPQRQPVAVADSPEVQDGVQRAFDLGNRFGLVDRIEELVASGKSDRQVQTDLGADLDPVRLNAVASGEPPAIAVADFVRSVRAGLGVPSQDDDPKAFKAWQQKFNQRRMDGATKDGNGLDASANARRDSGVQAPAGSATGAVGSVVSSQPQGQPGAGPVAEPVASPVRADGADGIPGGSNAALTPPIEQLPTDGATEASTIPANEQDPQAGTQPAAKAAAPQAADETRAAPGVASAQPAGLPTAGPATEPQAAGVGAQWERMPTADRRAIVAAAGWKQSTADGPNIVGQRIARTAWDKMPGNVRARIAAAVEGRPPAALPEVKVAQTRASTDERDRDLGDDVRGPAMLADARLQHAPTVEYFKGMPSASGWSQVGGRMLRAPLKDGEGMEGEIIGRTPWIAASDWYGAMQRDTGTKLPGGREGVQSVIDRAIAGEPLTTQERRAARFMLGVAEQDADPLSAVNLARDQLKEAYDREALEEAQVDRLSNQEVQALAALIADAESLGIDTEAIKEDAAKATNTEREYHEAVTASIEEAIGRLRDAEQAAAGEPGESDSRGSGAGREQAQEAGLTLTAPTKAQVVAQQDAAEKERTDREAPADKPKSKLTGDQVDLFNPQGSVFDVPAQAAPIASETAPASDVTTAEAPTPNPAAPMGSAVLVQRQENARQSFIDSAVEQFNLTKEQARSAADGLLRAKLLKLDPHSGQFRLKDGRAWDKEVLLRAAGAALAASETAPERTYSMGRYGDSMTADEAVSKLKALEKEARDRRKAAGSAPTKFMQNVELDGASRAASLARKLRQDIAEHPAVQEALGVAPAQVAPKNAAAEQRAATETPAPAPITAKHSTAVLDLTPEQIATLEGKTVTIEALVSDTGATAQIRMDAAEAVRDIQKREQDAQKLMRCLA